MPCGIFNLRHPLKHVMKSELRPTDLNKFSLIVSKRTQPVNIPRNYVNVYECGPLNSKSHFYKCRQLANANWNYDIGNADLKRSLGT